MNRRLLPKRIRSKTYTRPHPVMPTRCWVWTGYRNSGYAWVHYDGKSRLGHRVVYQLLVGPIPDDMTLDHLCRNTACINPAHMEVVTRSENVARRNRALAGG